VSTRQFQRQTVFVEPLETIEQNNQLVRLLDEEQPRFIASSSNDAPDWGTQDQSNRRRRLADWNFIPKAASPKLHCVAVALTTPNRYLTPVASSSIAQGIRSLNAI